ncbi:MAG: hypothetical protein U0232_17055 [Thermomicrobiales bacterium]
MNALGLPTFIGSFALLFAVFPVVREVHMGRRRFSAQWILLPAPLVTLSYLAIYIAPGNITFQIEISSPPRTISLLPHNPAWGSWCQDWWQSKEHPWGKQLRILAIGSCFAVAPFLDIPDLIPSQCSIKRCLHLKYAALPLCLIPISFGYAILRYQVMDLNLYVRRGHRFTRSSPGLSRGSMVSRSSSRRSWPGLEQLSNVVAVGVIAVFLAVASDQLRARLTRFVDRLFDRRHYDYRQQLLEFSQQMSTIEDPDGANGRRSRRSLYAMEQDGAGCASISALIVRRGYCHRILKLADPTR